MGGPIFTLFVVVFDFYLFQRGGAVFYLILSVLAIFIYLFLICLGFRLRQRRNSIHREEL